VPAARLIDAVRATPRTRRLLVGLDVPPFDFAAGQAVVVGLAGSGDRAPYSIASAPSRAARGTLELLVPGDGAFGQAALDPLDVVGAALDVDGPVGTFGVPRAAQGAPLLLVAGGTGIAPLRSIVLDRLDRGDTSPLTLVYSVRTPDEFAFAEEFVAFEQAGHLTLHATITRDDRPTDGPARSGRVDRTLLAGALPAGEPWCLICGPAGFVTTVTWTLAELGVAPERIVVER
jgi:ferredoxin-NADP reductase